MWCNEIQRISIETKVFITICQNYVQKKKKKKENKNKQNAHMRRDVVRQFVSFCLRNTLPKRWFAYKIAVVNSNNNDDDDKQFGFLVFTLNMMLHTLDANWLQKVVYLSILLRWCRLCSFVWCTKICALTRIVRLVARLWMYVFFSFSTSFFFSFCFFFRLSYLLSFW